MFKKLPTMQELYGQDVCNDVLSLPTDDRGYLILPNGEYACLVGALNAMALHKRYGPYFAVRTVPFSFHLAGDYEKATGKRMNDDGCKAVLNALHAFDRAVGRDKNSVVKEMCSKTSQRGEK